MTESERKAFNEGIDACIAEASKELYTNAVLAYQTQYNKGILYFIQKLEKLKK